MTQQNSSNWFALAKQLKLRHVNVDVNQVRQTNKECQKEIMVHETGLYAMIEFDIAIYLFALFQLGLTNLIVFKLNFKFMNPDLLFFSMIMLSRRIVCKINHYYQINIYRVNLLMFTVLRSVPLAICLVLIWLLCKIAIFNSYLNLICVPLP